MRPWVDVALWRLCQTKEIADGIFLHLKMRQGWRNEVWGQTGIPANVKSRKKITWGDLVQVLKILMT
jgi:hypothetical protein